MQALTQDTKKPATMGGQSCAVAYGLLVVPSLVQGHRGDGKLHAIRASIRREKLRGLDSSTKLLDLRDVRRVHADERTSGDCTVQLRLSSRNLRSSIRAGHGEVERTTQGRLDGLDGRRSTREHQRGPFRVQVGVAVLNELERTPDVGECEGHVGGGCEVDGSHFLSVLSRRSRRRCRFIVYIIPDRAGKVNTFFVKSLQTVCQSLALVVAGVSRAAHVINIAH